MFLYKKIKEARIEKKMTQKQLAEELTKRGRKTSFFQILFSFDRHARFYSPPKMPSSTMPAIVRAIAR